MDIKEIKKKLGPQFGFLFDFINSTVLDLNLDKDAKILDVGTGEGRMAIILALNNFKVITGEPKGDDSEYAKKDWLVKAKKVNVDHLITFKYFEAEKLPFEANYFDAIFTMGSLHHINNKASAFDEFIRTLKPDGVLGIFEPSPKGVKMMKQRSPSHPDAVDPRIYAQKYPLSMEIKESPMFNAFIFIKKN